MNQYDLIKTIKADLPPISSRNRGIKADYITIHFPEKFYYRGRLWSEYKFILVNDERVVLIDEILKLAYEHKLSFYMRMDGCHKCYTIRFLESKIVYYNSIINELSPWELEQYKIYSLINSV